MRYRAFYVVALVAVTLVLAGCGGDHSPSAPSSLGTLRFKDSGCFCSSSSTSPEPPVTVYVDGRPYEFPLFGSLNVYLSPGLHAWSEFANDSNPTTVQIVAGQTVNVSLFSNVGCPDGCGDTTTFGAPSGNGATQVPVVAPSAPPAPTSPRSRPTRR